MKQIAWALLLSAGLFANAHAENVRFPQSGYPAFVIQTPDGWTHKPDDSGNMLLLSPNHTSSFALSMVAYDGTAEDLATKALSSGGNTPKPAGKEALAGFDGDAFDTSLTNAGGTHVNVHMIAAKPDAKHVATVSCITVEDIGADDYNEVQGILQGVDIETGQQE